MTTKSVDVNELFNLEQQIMDCWKLTDTIKSIGQHFVEDTAAGTMEDLQKLLNSVAETYNFQFEMLQKAYEELLRN